jgi:hypothetical protein
MPRPLLVAFALVFTLPALAGEIYTWKDKDGHVQYSDTPPPGVDAKPIRSQSSSGGIGSDSGTKSLQERERSFNERQKARDDSAKKSAEQEKVAAAEKQRCDDLRARLQTYEIGGRIAKIQDGERVVVPEEERLSEIDKMKATIAKDCK